MTCYSFPEWTKGRFSRRRRQPKAAWWLGALALVLLVLPASPVFAQTLDKKDAGLTQISERVSVEVYAGTLRGESRELVYNAGTGKKVSELFWNIDSAYVVGGTLAVKPREWLTLRLGGWMPVKSRNTMDDYDWMVNGRADWSDWSNHPDTRMNRAYTLDAGITARVATFDKTKVFDRATIDLLAGYRWFNMGWTAYGGSYVYSSGGGWRNDVGANPDGEPGIAYEQWIETPYLGVGGSMAVNRWTFNAEVTGSLWARGRDRDNHYNRTLLFEDTFDNMAMLSGDLSVGYALTPRLSLVGRAVYTRYFEGKGPTTQTNYSTGAVTYYPGDAAGMDHRSFLLNLGLSWKMF